jgi:hypothetical protein
MKKPTRGQQPRTSAKNRKKNRNGGRQHTSRQQHQPQLESSAPSHDFNGREPTLNGFIYDVVIDPGHLMKTKKEITNFVERAYNEYPDDLSNAAKILSHTM